MTILKKNSLCNFFTKFTELIMFLNDYSTHINNYIVSTVKFTMDKKHITIEPSGI